jgi:hypothetical protein
MRLPINIIPQEIIEAYNLMPLVHNGHVYIEIQRGMHGLPQAGIIANQLLTQRLIPQGYYQCRHTPGLWRHQWRPILFSLVVDDFGISYVGQEHAPHIIQAIETDYDFTKDWSGTLYCGITIKCWNYKARTAELSMPGYIPNALHKYQHPAPKRPQHTPHTWNQPQYGATQQLADPGDTTDPASDLQQKRIQKVTGTLLFYARAVNPTMLMTISTITAQQSKATQNTVKATNQLLDYCHTHPNATLKYRASDMILKIHSDASYNAEPKGRSRGGGHYYLGDKPSATPEQPQGPLLNRSNVIKNVMGSATEAEVGALYDNLREGVPL